MQDIIVVNLDCDQVFAPSFLATVLNSFSGVGMQVQDLSDQFVAACVPGVSASGGGGPLTGRIAVHGPSFLRIGLYDEEEGIVGSGGQDVDLVRRLLKVFPLYPSAAADPLTPVLSVYPRFPYI